MVVLLQGRKTTLPADYVQAFHTAHPHVKVGLSHSFATAEVTDGQLMSPPVQTLTGFCRQVQMSRQCKQLWGRVWLLGISGST